ncbi:hypothetical protein RUND412_007404 [Rhizina undulata]
MTAATQFNLQPLGLKTENRVSERVKFPPVVKGVDFLGEVREENAQRYSRSIGCSSIIADKPLFIFGDTFAFGRPPRSQYLKICSSTASIGSLYNATSTRYTVHDPQDESKISQFIPFTRAEEAYNASRGKEIVKPDDRFYLWAFNPVVEIPGEKGIGVFWFVKGKTNDNKPDNNAHYGVGVAEVRLINGLLQVKRKEHLLFDHYQPAYGQLTTLLHGNHIYLYGPRLKSQARPNTMQNIFLCRVPYRDKLYLFSDNYEFWNGTQFAPSQSNLRPVMQNLESGTIFHTHAFGDIASYGIPSPNGRGHGTFIFVGCNNTGDNKVRLKTAPSPWGPWSGDEWILDLSKEERGNRGVKSCIYAHVWASSLDKGQLTISWSEPWPGGVEMAKIRFAMEESKGHKGAGFNQGYGLRESPSPNAKAPSEHESEDDFVLDDELRNRLEALARLVGEDSSPQSSTKGKRKGKEKESEHRGSPNMKTENGHQHDGQFSTAGRGYRSNNPFRFTPEPYQVAYDLEDEDTPLTPKEIEARRAVAYAILDGRQELRQKKSLSVERSLQSRSDNSEPIDLASNAGSTQLFKKESLSPGTSTRQENEPGSLFLLTEEKVPPEVEQTGNKKLAAPLPKKFHLKRSHTIENRLRRKQTRYKLRDTASLKDAYSTQANSESSSGNIVYSDPGPSISSFSDDLSEVGGSIKPSSASIFQEFKGKEEQQKPDSNGGDCKLFPTTLPDVGEKTPPPVHIPTVPVGTTGRKTAASIRSRRSQPSLRERCKTIFTPPPSIPTIFQQQPHTLSGQVSKESKASVVPNSESRVGYESGGYVTKLIAHEELASTKPHEEEAKERRKEKKGIIEWLKGSRKGSASPSKKETKAA